MRTLPELLCSRPVVFAASLCVFLTMASRFVDHTVDDAFISFRYAAHLAGGEGLVYNVGERVEGYTNFLWVVLLAPFLRWGADPELTARILGLLASAGLLAGVVRFAPIDPRSGAVVWVAPLCVALSPVLAVWATGGLEGPLFACLVTWAAGATAQGIARGRLRLDAALWIGLAALTRPEGALLALVLLAAAVASTRPSLREVGRFAAVFLALFLPYFLWRLHYYGDPLPNTFYAKVGASGAQVARGAGYVMDFLRESAFAPLIPLAGLVWVRREAPWIFAAMGGVLLSWVVFVGGDSLPMYRFLLPLVPLVSLLGAWGVVGAIRASGAGERGRAACCAVALALCLVSALPAFRGEARELVEIDRREVAAWKEIGVHFAKTAAPDESIAVVTAGAIPFFSGLRAIDMLGLNDRTIAHRAMGSLGTGAAGHEKFDVSYVLDREPTYVVVGTYGICPDARPVEEILRPFYPAEIELLGTPRFHSEYRPVRARSPSGYFVHFVRRGSPADQRLSDRAPTAPG